MAAEESQIEDSGSTANPVNPHVSWFACAFQAAAKAQGDHKMKHIYFLIVSLLALPLLIAGQEQRSRDLYLHYESGATSVGQPGAKLTVELNRNGKIRMVSPDTVFRSGDRIRFHLALNFEGYLAVFNSGTSGKLNCLYPYLGAPNPVRASAELMVPGNEAWFAFDQTPGAEEVTFLMSKDPIQELGGLPGSSAGDMGRGIQAGGVPGHAEQATLGKLRARAAQGSRDLQLEFASDGAYGTASENDLSGLVKFSVRLNHKK